MALAVRMIERDAQLSPQDAADVEAIDGRQHQVQQQQVGPAPTRQVECLPAVIGHQHLVAVALQVQPQQVDRLGVVVYDEDLSVHLMILWQHEVCWRHTDQQAIYLLEVSIIAKEGVAVLEC